MIPKSRQSQRQDYKWEQKYTTLLEKNQNDLIKIRLREKQLNETIGKLEMEKQQIKIDFSEKIKILQAEIEKLRYEKSSEKLQTAKLRNLRQQGNITAQKNELMQKIAQQKRDFQAKLKKLQIELQNSKQENIQLTSQLKNQQENFKNSTKIFALEQIDSNKEKINQLQKKVNELQRENQKQRSHIQQLEKQKNAISQKQKPIEHEMNTKQKKMERQQQTLFTEVQRLRQLLTLTNTQYKNLAHKEELKQQLIASKNDELNMMTQQLIDMQQKLQKSKQFEAYKTKYNQQWTKREQLEQQNMLLKEIIKSHKTMLKIKQNQIVRLQEKVQNSPLSKR